jgi:hypothetical protein
MVSTLNAARLLRQTGAIPQNVNFAVKSSYVKALLSSHSSKAWDAGQAPLDAPQRSLSDMVEATKGSVVFIQVQADVDSSR